MEPVELDCWLDLFEEGVSSSEREEEELELELELRISIISVFFFAVLAVVSFLNEL